MGLIGSLLEDAQMKRGPVLALDRDRRGLCPKQAGTVSALPGLAFQAGQVRTGWGESPMGPGSLAYREHQGLDSVLFQQVQMGECETRQCCRRSESLEGGSC